MTGNDLLKHSLYFRPKLSNSILLCIIKFAVKFEMNVSEVSLQTPISISWTINNIMLGWVGPPLEGSVVGSGGLWRTVVYCAPAALQSPTMLVMHLTIRPQWSSTQRHGALVQQSLLSSKCAGLTSTVSLVCISTIYAFQSRFKSESVFVVGVDIQSSIVASSFTICLFISEPTFGVLIYIYIYIYIYISLSLSPFLSCF